MLGTVEYETVLLLHKKGISIRRMRKLLGYARNTIKKVLRERTPPPFNTSQRESILDDYKGYIQGRCEEARLPANTLYEEIVPLGYEGSIRTVRNFLATLPTANVGTIQGEETHANSTFTTIQELNLLHCLPVPNF